jgi:hypothetical protein
MIDCAEIVRVAAARLAEEVDRTMDRRNVLRLIGE